MKREEFKRLAKKIVAAERTIQRNSSPEEVENARSEIMDLSLKIKTLEDMYALDEFIFEILEEEKVDFPKKI